LGLLRHEAVGVGRGLRRAEGALQPELDLLHRLLRLNQRLDAGAHRLEADEARRSLVEARDRLRGARGLPANLAEALVRRAPGRDHLGAVSRRVRSQQNVNGRGSCHLDSKKKSPALGGALGFADIARYWLAMISRAFAFTNAS